MSQSNQEQAARRFHTDNYDCQPTSDVLEELIAPKRPRILSRPRASAKGPLGWLYLVLAAVFIVVVALSTTWRPQRATERARDHNAITQPVAPQLTPASTPVPLQPGSADNWKAYLAEQQTRVPRAELVKPVPRAELVALPAPRAQLALIPGKQYTATMPYDNLEVLATFRGWLPSQDDLPSHPNHIGDMFVINGVPFVWLFPPGASRAGWIDP
jgi:hypothetical protein